MKKESPEQIIKECAYNTHKRNSNLEAHSGAGMQSIFLAGWLAI